MFPKELATLYDTICDAHDTYETDITIDELYDLHVEFNPTLTKPARDNLRIHLDNVAEEEDCNPEIAKDIAISMWRRDRARIIAEEALDIFSGDEIDFTKLQGLVDEAIKGNPIELGKTYIEVTEGLDELVDDDAQTYEFKFTLPAITDIIPGMGRGNFGVILARPEVGKTTFATFLAAEYIRQGFKVAYFMNEEPARKTKLRIIQAYLGLTKDEIRDTMEDSKAKFSGSSSLLKMFDCVGMDIEELKQYCAIHEPDVVIIDQMDKLRVKGDFGRGDERLKQLYVEGRETAKRHRCLVWAVSQASADADNQVKVDYTMLDSSKTGKPGEADLIVGIGKSKGQGDEGRFRGMYFSKNKINGVHDLITVQIDPERGRYIS